MSDQLDIVPVKVVLFEPTRDWPGETASAEVEIGPFSHGVTLDQGHIVDVATSERVITVSLGNFALARPGPEGRKVWYKRMFVQGAREP